MPRSIRDKYVEKLNKGMTFVAQLAVLGETLNQVDIAILTALKTAKDLKQEMDIQELAKHMKMYYSPCWQSVKKLERVGKIMFFSGLVKISEKEGKSKYVSITEIGEEILEQYVYVGESDKTYLDRLVNSIKKRNPKLVRPEYYS